MSYKSKTTKLISTINTKVYLFVICLLNLIIIPPSLATNVDNIRFPESAWDGQVLYKLETGPNYLDKNIEFDLPPPPFNSSEETQNELLLLNKYALEERTSEQVKKIRSEAEKGKFSEIFLNAGPVNKKLRDSAYRILDFADKEIVYFIVHYKKRFSRPRPSQLAPDLELVVPNPGHAAYPSGHATQAMVFSKILSLIDSKNKNTYIQYALDIAKRREIAGVHYPSDSAAGQLLAGKLLEKLMQVPEFNKQLEEAKARYRQNKS